MSSPRSLLPFHVAVLADDELLHLGEHGVGLVLHVLALLAQDELDPLCRRGHWGGELARSGPGGGGGAVYHRVASRGDTREHTWVARLRQDPPALSSKARLYKQNKETENKKQLGECFNLSNRE